jgi:copper(I)-binding protein
MAMLHQTVVDGDSSRMSPVEGGLEIPPAGEVVLAPGGYHFMLTNLVEPLEVGDIVHATLEFEDAGMVMIEATVTGGTGGEMKGMSHDDDE